MVVLITNGDNLSVNDRKKIFKQYKKLKALFLHTYYNSVYCFRLHIRRKCVVADTPSPYL